MDPSASSESSATTFKKRIIRKNAARRRKSSSSADDKSSDSNPGPVVIRPAKKTLKPNPNFHTSISSNKSRNLLHHQDDSNDGSSESGDDDVGVRYKSGGALTSQAKQRENATATYELDTELDKDAQAIFEKSLAVNKELEGKADDKIYRGLNNYAMYYKKRDTAAGNASSGLVRKGPIRAPANLRATVRWDYQPDICKDYKETGFCGFGDSCKFLHDRGDYKHGWQLERETEMRPSRSHNDGEEDDERNYEIDSDEDNMPFKCFICRNSFTDPVVTKCKHYFCEKCALEQYKKSQRCYICNQQTTGVFNPANELIGKIKLREELPHASSDEGGGSS